MAPIRRRRRGAVILILSIVILGIYILRPFSSPASNEPTKAIVMARMKKDDVSWVSQHLSDWQLKVYTMDDPRASPRVPKNKGREAMAYLTYIVTHYKRLPDIVVFIHGERYQWHNDDPLYDQVSLLHRLQLPYVLSSGYANLRCSWSLGCPREILPNLPPPATTPTTLPEDQTSLPPPQSKKEYRHPADTHYATAYRTLFNLPPSASVPSHIGASCCAQFAASRSQILRRPLTDYLRMRKWLLDTELDDMTAGRIMEYSWHIIMGRPGVHCPVAQRCYCDVFGLCGGGVRCTIGECKVLDTSEGEGGGKGSKGRVEGGEWVYTMPKSRYLPFGWPDVKEEVKEMYMYGEAGKESDDREKELKGER